MKMKSVPSVNIRSGLSLQLRENSTKQQIKSGFLPNNTKASPTFLHLNCSAAAVFMRLSCCDLVSVGKKKKDDRGDEK